MNAHLSTPIYIPRWVLTVKYALFILLGVTVWWTTSPSLVQVTGDPYTTGWSWFVIAAGTVALIGSLKKRLELVETIGATGLACLFLAYAVAPIWLVVQGDADKAAYSVAALIVSLLPAARALQLLNRSARA